VTGFSDIRREPTDGDDDETNDYYAGGERSGQVVRAPKKATDLADTLFKKARENVPSEEEMDEFRGEQKFTGAGYRLDRGSAAADGPDVVGRKNVTRTFTFYRNGFVVDDGPLRAFDDPANRTLLEEIDQGFVPREMEEPGIGNVSIQLVDRKGDDYIPEVKKVVPFAGEGQRLAGPSSSGNTTGVGPVDTQAMAEALSVDESRRVVSVQVRLHDGTRIVARVNEDHTVGDVRRFVALSRPNAAFSLSTTFPKKVLTDDNATVKEAGLAGAVVVQTLI